VLTILVIYGSKTSINSRTRNVGIGSSDDDLTGDDVTILRTVTRVDQSKTVEVRITQPSPE